MQNKQELPTQLYVSLDAPNEQMHHKMNVPQIKDSWKQINKTLELLPKINTRRVMRITAVRNWNITDPKDYAQLIQKSEADFVEIKAYMAVGFSRQRKGLGMPAMPFHKEVVDFAKQINEQLGYKWLDEKEESRVVLLGSGEKDAKISK
jgi:tRNA wybutosine-synthesizing protein 1